jgi:nucleoside phosphorylase
MANRHNPKLRFGMTLREAEDSSFEPSLANAPPLPAIDYELVGKPAPTLLPPQSGQLPKASTVVMTWAGAEWAALQHVFCAGGSAMPYSERSRGSWAGWEQYSANLPSDRPSGWSYWGYYRTVEINGAVVLLFKSNTHLDFPGATFLTALIKLIIADVKPGLILSIGTAGGTKPQDHIGTVRAVSAGTMFETGKPASSWPEYENGWTANWATVGNANFEQLLFPVPTKTSDLQALCSQFNQQYQTNYPLEQLNPSGLNLGDPAPQIDNQTGGAASLLTASTFVVGTTAETFQSYAAIEMDDAVIGAACGGSSTAFGFVRNLSDPAQNAALPQKVQGNWGSAVYDQYGFYTSYNGALAAWAMLA